MTNEWQNVALKLGELLSSQGPEGYYNFTPDQWFEWVKSQLNNPIRLNQIEFLDKLKELVVKYDKQEGRYQESEYEGYEFYAFVCEEFNQDFDPRDKLTKEYPELYDREDY